jgi:hypothetical protein
LPSHLRIPALITGCNVIQKQGHVSAIQALYQASVMCPGFSLSRLCCRSASLWCGHGSRSCFSLWCGSGFNLSLWCGSGSFLSIWSGSYYSLFSRFGPSNVSKRHSKVSTFFNLIGTRIRISELWILIFTKKFQGKVQFYIEKSKKNLPIWQHLCLIGQKWPVRIPIWVRPYPQYISRIRILNLDYGSADPDPLTIFTDPEHWLNFTADRNILVPILSH